MLSRGRLLWRYACSGGALLWLWMGLAGSACADGFYCGNRVITSGMPQIAVQAACGEPAQVTRSSILRRPVFWRHGRPWYASDDLVPVPVETWVYNFGTQRLMQELRFVDGVLEEIATLGYGFNQ